MLKFFNANQKNSLKKLELILNKRKLKQQTKSATVKKILFDVKLYDFLEIVLMKRFFVFIFFQPLQFLQVAMIMQMLLDLH